MRPDLFTAVFCLLLPIMVKAEAPVAAPNAAPLSVQAMFAALPLAEDPHLSPDGSAVAMIAPHEQRAAVRVWREGMPEQWFTTKGNNQLNWIAWKGNDRLLLSVRLTYQDSNGRKVGVTRLMITDLSSRQSTNVSFREPAPPPNIIVVNRRIYQPPNLQDRVVSMLPQDPDRILVAASSSETTVRPGLIEVDIRDGHTEPTQRPVDGVVKWLADPHGKLRLRQTLEWKNGKRNDLTVRVKDDERDDWRVVHRGVVDRDPRFIPLAFAANNPNLLYVLADQDNGRLALRGYDIRSQTFGALLAADQVCDIEPLVRDNQLVGYVDPCQGPSETYFDLGWQHDQDLARRALKSHWVSVIDRSADGKFALLRSAAGPNAPVSFWYFAQSGPQKSLTRLADSYPDLTPNLVAPTRRVTVTARDGLTIPALLTMPAADGPIGFVVMPHGGPTAHDAEEFDWLVQFIVASGYGVLQPQFRGSSGFGVAFQKAGYRQWGGKMQDDVTDATHWLIDRQLADPKRICLFGLSYGGYSALMGAATQPGLYQCAAAWAPVTDLADLLDLRDQNEFGWLNRERTVGETGPLSRQSPLQLAEELTVPVLLMHGREDFTVPAAQSLELEARLLKARRPVASLYLDHADHFLSRGSDRLAVIRALDSFLSDHLGDGRLLSPS